MISGICRKHFAYSSGEEKSFLWRSVCFIRSCQKIISVSEESLSENSGYLSTTEAIISGRIRPMETNFSESEKISVFSCDTDRIVSPSFKY